MEYFGEKKEKEIKNNQYQLPYGEMPAFTCSKLTRETLEQRCEICSKLTIKTAK